MLYAPFPTLVTMPNDERRPSYVLIYAGEPGFLSSRLLRSLKFIGTNTDRSGRPTY